MDLDKVGRALIISAMIHVELPLIVEYGTKEQVKDCVTKYMDMLERNFPELKKIRGDQLKKPAPKPPQSIRLNN